MNTVRKLALTCSTLALGLSVTIYAQQSNPRTNPPQPETAKKASMGDSAFLKDAAQSNMAEVELAKLAEEKAADARIKEFAQEIEKDHQAAGAELTSLAQQKNVRLPSAPSTGDKMTKNSLSKKAGADFDKAWIDRMVKDHTQAVKDFEGAAKSKDAQIKSFAEKTLPTLREHLAKAQDLKKSISGF